MERLTLTEVAERYNAGEKTMTRADVPDPDAGGYTLGCYDFRAYCATGCGFGGSPGNVAMVEITGQTEAECLAAAKKSGWSIRRTKGGEKVLCPKCLRSGRRLKA